SSEIEILGGQAAGAVGRQTQGHLVVVDRNIGVMVGLLRQLTDLVHKGERLFKIPEGELFLYDFVFRQLPASEGAQFTLDLSLRERHSLISFYCLPTTAGARPTVCRPES